MKAGCLPGCLNPAMGVHHRKCPNYDGEKMQELHLKELREQHEAAAKDMAEQQKKAGDMSSLVNSNVVARKSGAFTDWKEDDEVAELFLPLPEGTVKKDLMVVIAADKLLVRTVKSALTLLRAEPLAGGVFVDESTWYLQGDLLLIVLAKQQVGATKSDQYWGASLAAKDGTVECYMKPSEVKAHRAAREKAASASDAEHHARVKASERQLRWKEQHPEEAPAPAPAQARRRVRKEAAEGGDDGAGARRPARRREPEKELFMGIDWTGVAIGLGIAAMLIVAWEAASRLAQSL